MSKKKLRKSEECLNCHQKIGDVNYCPNCGQINTSKDVPLRQFFKDFADDVFTIDSKLLKSFKPLLLKPGFLTKEYIKGRRVSYILPLRLYFFVTIVFFSLVTLQSKIFVEETNVVELDSDKTIQYTQLFETNLQRFPNLNDASIPLMALKFGTKYKIAPRDSAHKALLIAMKDVLKDDYSDSVYIDVIKNLVIQFQPRKKEQNNLLFLQLNKVLADTSRNRIYNTELNKTFLFNIAYYNPELLAWKGFASDLRLKYNLNKESADSIIRKTVMDYELKSRGKNNFNVFGSDPYQDMNIDTINPSFIDNILTRFIKKTKAVGQKDQSEFWKEMVDQIPTVMFIMLPIFAALYKVLYIRRKILYINHLIFSLHVHTIIFLYLLPSLLFTEWYTVLFTLFGSLIHIYLSMKSVYEQSHLKTILKLLLVLFLYFWCLIFGFILLTILSVIAI